MGVPVVALSGPRAAVRHSASHLANVGLDEFVAPNVEEYIATAVRLAGDPDRRVTLRKSLRSQMRGSMLCNCGTFTNNLEAVFRDIWAAWCGVNSQHNN